jgi:ribosomal protein S18 acetylase RimI-like enzyme
MAFEICRATLASAESLRQTLEEARRFKLSLGDDAWGEQPFTLEEVRSIITKGNTFVASLDGQPAGSLVLRWEDQRIWGKRGLDDQAGYLNRLAVRNNFRGQNLGEQLITWGCSQINAAGRSHIRLDCSPANVGLCAYYEHQGFQQKGVRDLQEYQAALYQQKV